MMNPYINNFINTLSLSWDKPKPLLLDVVFEGGLFNGSYLAGCLFYLKALEKRNLICIQRISGCSIGALTSLFYFIDNDELILHTYKIASQHFKEKHNLDMFNTLFALIRASLPDDIIEKINGKLYICYFNIKTRKHVVKHNYKNINDLFETIRRSASFPYIIDSKIYYKKKYIDGLYPYIFENTTNKILYLNIHHFNKMSGLISIKNEPNNILRILEGILEMHNFFLHGNKTSICSFTDEWTLVDTCSHYVFVSCLDILFFLLHYIYIIQNILRDSKDGEIGPFDIYKLFRHVYVYFLKKYCV